LYAVQALRYHPDTLIRWRNHQLYTSLQLPSAVRPWLLDPGSLTQRLIERSNGQFRVQIINQQWQQPRYSERALLDMKPREPAIIREVALLCGGKPWVFARSVLPASSLSGRLYRLRKFKDNALGEILFRDHSMRRYPFEIARLEGHSPLLPTHLQQSEALWGRRCRFELAGKPLMVSEFFLHNFQAQTPKITL